MAGDLTEVAATLRTTAGDTGPEITATIRRVREVSELMDSTNPDLAPFYARGGKLILYQGWLDPSIIASQSLDYAAAVRAKMGARTDDMLRLYMVPGMPHFVFVLIGMF